MTALLSAFFRLISKNFRIMLKPKSWRSGTGSKIAVGERDIQFNSRAGEIGHTTGTFLRTPERLLVWRRGDEHRQSLLVLA